MRLGAKFTRQRALRASLCARGILVLNTRARRTKNRSRIRRGSECDIAYESSMRRMQEIIGNVGEEDLSCWMGFGISGLGEIRVPELKARILTKKRMGRLIRRNGPLRRRRRTISPTTGDYSDAPSGLGLCQLPSVAMSASASFGPQVPRLYRRTRW